MTHINESLNVVLPIREEGDRGVTLYAYHTPIAREVFEANYRVLAATKAVLSSKGVHFLVDSGPRIASLTLRDEARKEAMERGEVDGQGVPSDAAYRALIAEMKRLTVVLVPGERGWDMIPVDIAITRGLLDDEEWGEAESALVFFTCHFAMSRRADRRNICTKTASLLRGSSTSLPATEFAASLQTSMPAETSGKKAASSVPC
jgi:hypothetical protein